MIEELAKAARYNMSKAGRLWTQNEIPWSHLSPGSRKFAACVAIFQGERGLKIDGMLGPDTIKAMREGVEPIEGTPHALIGGRAVEISKELEDACPSFDLGDRFEARKRDKSPTHIVIHESVTTSRDKTVAVLNKKGYGVHFIIDGDGSITQHCDPLRESPIHANQLNSSSIGIEIVNPYYPHRAVDPWIVTELAQWWTHVPKDRAAEYVKPTDAQIKACRALVVYLCEMIETLPLAFPTKDLGPRKTRIKGWKQKEKPDPGIVAHRDFASHADGRAIVEALLDLELEA